MNDTSDEDLARLQQACESLGEHFDSIQIFATIHDPDRGNGGTTNASWGSGNWFARKGQIEEWLGMDLKAMNEEQPGSIPNPYPNSKDPSNTIVEPTADGLKL